MKCSLGISSFLEAISSLSHSVVFLYFFALIAEEGFLISPCYSLAMAFIQDFPGGSDGKASAYNAGDPGSIPGSGRSPGKGNALSISRPHLPPVPDTQDPGEKPNKEQGALSTGCFRSQLKYTLSWNTPPQGQVWTVLVVTAWGRVPWMLYSPEDEGQETSALRGPGVEMP